MNTHKLVPSGGGTRHDFPTEHCFVKLAANDTNAGISLVEYELKPGFKVGRHHHKMMTQVFYLLDGEMEFTLDDGTTKLAAGDTLAIPTNVWHAAECKEGGRMLTIFKNGRFDEFLERLSGLTEDQIQNPEFMKPLCEEYDTYER